MRYVSSDIAADRLGKSESQVRRLCVADKFPGARKRKGLWEIPVIADPRLTQKPATQTVGEDVDLSQINPRKQREAQRKLGHIEAAQKAANKYQRNGGSRVDAIAVYALENDLKKATLYRWMQLYRRGGFAALVDNRGGDTSSGEQISQEAFEEFRLLWLSPQQLSVEACWRNIRLINREKGKGWTIPSLRTMQRLVKKRIPFGAEVLHREGTHAYEQKCAPHVQIDMDSIEAGQVWVGDHSQFNCWVRYRNKWIRPWLTAWEDMRSRFIVGWHITPAPNKTTILLAMKVGAKRWGVPESVKIDNGKDYRAYMWTGGRMTTRRVLRKGYVEESGVGGIYKMLGIDVSFALPYNAKAKPIERFFDTLDQQFTKTMATYCGKDPKRRPETLDLNNPKTIARAHDMEGFAALVGKYITVYNRRSHSGEGMKGKSPQQVFAARTTRRIVREGVLDMLLRVWTQELRIGKNGVRVNGMYYGQYDMGLIARQGERVRVAYDPEDVRRVYVHAADTFDLITVAEQNQLIRYRSAASEEDVREAMRRQRRIKKVHKEYASCSAERYMDLTSLTIRALNEAEQPPSDAGPASPTVLKPIRTVVDDTVAEYGRRVRQVTLKKAVGAESKKEELDMDFSLLKRPKNKHAGVKLEFPWEQ